MNKMIDTLDFYNTLIQNNFTFFTGVPDSLLKELCLCIEDLSGDNHILAANEGNAVAIASGYNIATSKYGVVYMQNSGIGNAVNPLLSLSDEKVYNIPMLLIVGYRGEPGIPDEPQHITQGELTLPLLDTLGIKNMILTEDYAAQITQCAEYIKATGRVAALVVRKGTFDKYSKRGEQCNDYKMTREAALTKIVSTLTGEDMIVSTTGKASREIFEIRERMGMKHSNDFLTVGSMGHASSLALGMSMQTDRKIYCIDGDGALIMHMGGLAVAIQKARDNFKYILINNGCHESVGGRKTVARDIDLEKILTGFGFDKVITVEDEAGLEDALKVQRGAGKIAVVANTDDYSRSDLGRPTISPRDNKGEFERIIRGLNESTDI